MKDVVEAFAGAIYGIRITSRGQWTIRLTAVGCLVVAGLLCLVWWPHVADMVMLVTLLLLGVWVLVQPASHASMLAVFVVALWWAVAGGDGAPWQVGIIGMLLAAFHLAGAWAAAAPSYAVVTRRSASGMIRVLAMYLAACLIAGGMVLALAGGQPVPLGFWWVAAAATVLLGLASWLVAHWSSDANRNTS